ncbi:MULTISPECIES: hypothetical protein [Vibrio]|uniref:Lipoprotein n=1 Tax=Vibrio vulnificus TaxID=672 RepID=A0A2S3R189_VIBVL|nr:MULTISPECIES: hypothetical protein [Vibrio]MCZ2802052.1 hypothetical protein [Vibrio alginolyticus]POB46862.1 hypothetical protein CRN52_12345 [Vibrio vulnificus]
MKKLLIAGLFMFVLAGCSSTQEKEAQTAEKNTASDSGMATFTTDQMMRTEAFKDVVRYQQQIIEISIEYANWKAEHQDVHLIPSEVEAKLNEISIKRTQMSSAELKKAHEDALMRAMSDI